MSRETFAKVAADPYEVDRMAKAFDAWWSSLSKRGDPARRIDLTGEAFAAGWATRTADDNATADLVRRLAANQRRRSV